ncbi:MAG: hypothetical protein HY343_04125 [Lentisphaerae bacterium]|nr:hypothetical protein [Lentisphaerota bacterium]
MHLPLLKGFGILLITSVFATLLAIVFALIARRRIPIMAFNLAATGINFGLSLAQVNWALVLQDVPRIGELALVMFLSAITNVGCIVFNILAMRLGHAALSYAIGQSAMALSFLYAIACWGEPMTPARILGLVLIVTMLVLAAPEKRTDTDSQSSGSGIKWFATVLAAFLCTGLTQIFYMTPSHWTGWQDSAHLRLPLFLGGMLLCFGPLAFGKRERLQRNMIGLIVGTALLGFGILALMLISVDMLTPLKLSGLAYPVVTGLSVLFFALYSRFILREIFNAKKWMGIALGGGGIILMCF